MPTWKPLVLVSHCGIESCDPRRRLVVSTILGAVFLLMSRGVPVEAGTPPPPPCQP